MPAPAEEARARLDRDGFCAIGEAFSPGLAPRMRALGERLLAEEDEAARRAMRSLGSLISLFRDPGFADIIVDPGLHDTLARLGFRDLRFSAGYFLSKPPGSPASFWHQDWGFWGEALSYRDPTPQVGVLWYLVDVDTTNGCPRFLAGSHRRRHALHDVVEAIDVAELRRGHDLSLPVYQHPPEAVSVPVRAGEVVLFDPRVLHGAHANGSARERPAFSMWFYRDHGALPEGIRAFAAGGEDPRAGWPVEARARTDALMPEAPGGADVRRAELIKYPDARLT